MRHQRPRKETLCGAHRHHLSPTARSFAFFIAWLLPRLLLFLGVRTTCSASWARAALQSSHARFDDGSPATVKQYAHDVTTFLMWAAEPHMEERKRIGMQVFFFLVIFAILMNFTKRKVWADAH